MSKYLLDKNIARRVIEALTHLETLSAEEEMVLRLWRQFLSEGSRLFIPFGALNILQRLAHLIEVRSFLTTVEPLESGRYLKRWARRLREHQFTREDALILALATYGTSTTGNILGIDVLITLDRPFINNFRANEKRLENRLSAMINQLPEPYSHAKLPLMQHPEEIILRPPTWVG
jgi:hypothetical protein